MLRVWIDSFDMKICTEKRGSKLIELTDNYNVDVCMFLPISFCQFSFRGKKIECEKETSIHWELIDEQAKSLWNRQTSGE